MSTIRWPCVGMTFAVAALTACGGQSTPVDGSLPEAYVGLFHLLDHPSTQTHNMRIEPDGSVWSAVNGCDYGFGPGLQRAKFLIDWTADSGPDARIVIVTLPGQPSLRESREFDGLVSDERVFGTKGVSDPPERWERGGVCPVCPEPLGDPTELVPCDDPYFG